MNQTDKNSEQSNLLKMNFQQTPIDTVASSVGSNNKEQQQGEIPTFWSGGKQILVGGPLNILLLCIPFAFAAKYWNWGDSLIFVFSLLSLAPLAERLGFITEQLAMHTNDTIGGLLNATFGNAPELIVAIAALNHGLYRLVQLSLLGSILSNLLLVLGTSFICGGLRFKTQYFNKISSQVNSTLLMLCGAGVMFPTILSLSKQETPLGEVGFSRATCVVLVVVYIAFLYFQLITHRDVYEEEPEEQPHHTYNHHKKVAAAANSTNDNNNGGSGSSGMNSSVVNGGYGSLSTVEIEMGTGYNRIGASIGSDSQQQNSSTGDEEQQQEEEQQEEQEEDEPEKDLLGFWFALLWLCVVTVFISFLSEYIADSIEKGAKGMGVSALFLSAIVLPIVGNAAEHAGAVMFALKNKLDLSLGIAVGSSTQIALLVLPVSVLIGWVSGRDMTLNFGAFEVATLFVAVVTVTIAIKDGKSNWLTGFALIAVYVVISLGFWADDTSSLE